MLRSAAVGLALWRIKKMCLGMAHGCKDGICGMSVMSAEPADSRATPVADAQKHFLHLALAVAKHNAVYRARYPEDDPIYQMVEGSFFGTFDDMPIQLHIFADAAESANQCAGLDHEAQARSLAEQLAKARAWAGHPTRDARGTVLWRKSLPFAGPALADEIERSARQFFTTVYSLRNVKKRTLRPHEVAFWARLKRVRRAQRKAKRDREDLYHVILCLQQRLPAICCAEIVRMAM